MADKATAFSASNSRPQIAALTAMCLFILAMFWLWKDGHIGYPPRPGRECFVWVSIGFFALLSLHGLWRFFDTGEQLRISAEGLFWRGWSGETIPWSAISGAKLKRHPRGGTIRVELANPARYPPTTMLAHLLMRYRGGAMVIGLGGMDHDTEAAIRAIRKYLAA